MEGKPDNESIGWTNYAPCVIPELREIFDSAHEDNSDFQVSHKVKTFFGYIMKS